MSACCPSACRASSYCISHTYPTYPTLVKSVHVRESHLHKGGTAKASTAFQNQVVAVVRETALARTRLGKISAVYVHDVGPHVVANVATKMYENATTAFEAALFFSMIQLISSFVKSLVSPVFSWPKHCCRPPNSRQSMPWW